MRPTRRRRRRGGGGGGGGGGGEEEEEEEEEGRIACYPSPNRRPPATNALHTTCGNNTSIVSSS